MFDFLRNKKKFDSLDEQRVYEFVNSYPSTKPCYNSTIARGLGLSTKVVDKHISNLSSKGYTDPDIT